MYELVIDTSHWDGTVDFNAWKNQRGLWGVIIKAGGNETGLGRYTDSQFETSYNNAKAAGLHIGAYYYTVSTSTGEAYKDAEHFAGLLAGKSFDLPVYMDVEDQRQFNLSARDLTDVIKTFCDKMSTYDYISGLYTSGSAWVNNMYMDELLGYANWIASWSANWPSYAGDIGMWQQGTIHLGTGDIQYADVSGYTDCDWCVIDYPSRINGGTPEPVVIPEQHPGDKLTNDGFNYRAHCENAGWFPAVGDGQVAGSTGYGKRMEALKFRPTEAMGTLDVDVHIQDDGWVEFHGIKAGANSGEGSSSTDPICGTTGQSKRMEAIKLSLKDNKTGKKLRYMGHVQDIGWCDPVWEGEVCGTTGQSRRLEAIRVWLDDPNNPIDINKKEEIKEEDTFMAGKAADVINAAYGELGYYAPDDPERGSKYGRWMAEVTGEDWMAGPSSEIWWCCMFVSWCLNQGGVQMDGFPTQNTDLALNGGAKKYAINIYDMQYGDIVIFNWDWDSATDHIGFVTGAYDGYGFPTIEGNVGNAVAEKYRQIGNVAYILRPPYTDSSSGQTPSVSTDPRNNRDGGTLDVDGIGGWNTIIDWQNQLGTYEDGWISGQVTGNADYHWGMSNVTYGGEGSQLVQAIQNKVGAGADGQWGPDTSRKIQQWLADKGYDIGDSGVDGYFGRDSVRALQNSLNDGAWR